MSVMMDTQLPAAGHETVFAAMNGASVRSDPQAVSVVTLSFRQTQFKKRSFVPVGPPVLEIELLGEQHTLTDAAKSLFQHYLRDVLGEELYMHVWRFEVVDEDLRESMAFDAKTPLLDEDMLIKEPFAMGISDPEVRPLELGSEMLFKYDEGSPTILAVRVEGIQRKKHFDQLEEFPRVKGVAAAGFSEALVLASEDSGCSLDTLFPELAKVVLSKRYAGSFFGNCAGKFFGCVEGGPHDGGDQLWTPHPFQCLEDYLISVNKFWPLIAEITEKDMITEGFVNILLFPPENLGEEEESKIVMHMKTLDRVEQYLAIGYDHLSCMNPRRCKELMAEKGLEKPTKEEEFMMFGPRQIVCRMTVEELAAEKEALRSQGFDFAEKYPTIHKCTVKGSPDNIWFKVYQQHVLVAKGMTKYKEERLPRKVLSQSPHSYATMRDIFQAVEDTLTEAFPPSNRKKPRQN